MTIVRSSPTMTTASGSHAQASRKPRTRRAGGRRIVPASGQVDRKAWQLCRQVGHTLDEVLAECGDAVLQGLRVESVEPFPDASRLLVTVAFIDGRPGRVREALHVVDRLEHASGHLALRGRDGRHAEARTVVALPAGRASPGDRSIVVSNVRESLLERSLSNSELFSQSQLGPALRHHAPPRRRFFDPEIREWSRHWCGGAR